MKISISCSPLSYKLGADLVISQILIGWRCIKWLGLEFKVRGEVKDLHVLSIFIENVRNYMFWMSFFHCSIMSCKGQRSHCALNSAYGSLMTTNLNISKEINPSALTELDFFF